MNPKTLEKPEGSVVYPRLTEEVADDMASFEASMKPETLAVLEATLETNWPGLGVLHYGFEYLENGTSHTDPYGTPYITYYMTASPNFRTLNITDAEARRALWLIYFLTLKTASEDGYKFISWRSLPKIAQAPCPECDTEHKTLAIQWRWTLYAEDPRASSDLL